MFRSSTSENNPDQEFEESSSSSDSSSTLEYQEKSRKLKYLSIANRISKIKSSTVRKQMISQMSRHDLYQAAVAQAEMRISSHKIIKEPTLIGDGTQNHCLPLVEGRHPDLKAITPNTLAELIDGDLSDAVEYEIIDCRYPYEFEAGHIEDAINIYSKKCCLKFLTKCRPLHVSENRQRKKILIFYCEFSTRRAPAM